jgi:carbonic anhydrase/acetyltransferase-like protein (isoleucine patch superfamily)
MFQKLVNVTVILMILIIAGAGGYYTWEKQNHKPINVRANVAASFNSEINSPQVDATAYIHPMASVIGNVIIGERVFVAPVASIRGDEGQPIYIGNESNVQDGVVLHALETEKDGEAIEKNLIPVEDKKYAVYVGNQVSLAHQSQVHGPAKIGDGTFIGMQALVFKAQVGKNCVIEPGAKVLGGVKIADGRYVPAGTVVNTQEAADKLPEIIDTYPFKNLNKSVIEVNTQLADGYRAGKE